MPVWKKLLQKRRRNIRRAQPKSIYLNRASGSDFDYRAAFGYPYASPSASKKTGTGNGLSVERERMGTYLERCPTTRIKRYACVRPQKSFVGQQTEATAGRWLPGVPLIPVAHPTGGRILILVVTA